MMQSFWKHILAILALVALTIWLAVFTYPEPNLHLIACDVEQGDTTLFIYGKTGVG